jgi:hypothetical protein
MCGASRYLEVDLDARQKRQIPIPVKIIGYMLFIQRIQQLHMIEESTKNR